MKKRYFWAFLLAFAIIFVLLFQMPRQLYHHLPLEKQVCCKIFCRQTSAEDCVNVGYGYVVSCSGYDFEKTLQLCKQVDGVSFTFDYVAVAQKVVAQLDWSITSCQRLQNIQIVCGYSPKICGGVWLDGKKVNLQIALCGSSVTIGSPLILDSY